MNKDFRLFIQMLHKVLSIECSSKMEKLLVNLMWVNEKMIKLNFFEAFNISVTWETVIVGRKLKLADQKFIEDFAVKYLIQNSNCKDMYIIELAYGIKDYSLIDQVLQNIEEKYELDLEENSQGWNKEKRKWRFLALNELLNKNYTNKRILEEIENIYWDFGHPEDMNEFLIFMPHDPINGYDFQKHSAEENFSFMVQRFKQFLFNEYQELSK